MIKNIHNERMYIGRSRDIVKRCKTHISQLKHGRHHCCKLQEDYNETKDIHDFEFIIIEEVDDESKLPEREQYYYDVYNSCKNGYNCYPIANNPVDLKFDSNFVWLKFVYNEELFSNLNVSPQDLARLIYIATFCNEDGSLMRKRELLGRLRLSKARKYEFWNTMIKKEILYESDGLVFINSKYFTKGKFKSNETKIKLFCESIRALYESCSPTDHVQLANIYKIIPYVNRYNNILCKFPTQQDAERICPMTVGEFCDLLGYDKNNARRYVNALSRFRINNELVMGIFPSGPKKKDVLITINPLLYFGGIKDEMYYAQLDLFNKEREKYLANNGIQHEVD